MKFNTDLYKKIVLDHARETVNELLNEYYQALIYYSPVDTWAYQRSHKITYKNTDSTIRWMIDNDISYAESVEHWFEERKWEPVNWHINNRKVIFTAVWAETYSHAFAQMKPVFERRMKKFLKSLK